MKLAKAPCPVAGCKYVAEHVKENYAKAMLGRHKSKEHGIVSPAAKYYKKNQPRISEVETVLSDPSLKSTLGFSITPQQSPNFCPNCGCHLRAITVAMNLKGRR